MANINQLAFEYAYAETPDQRIRKIDKLIKQL